MICNMILVYSVTSSGHFHGYAHLKPDQQVAGQSGTLSIEWKK